MQVNICIKNITEWDITEVMIGKYLSLIKVFVQHPSEKLSLISARSV